MSERPPPIYPQGGFDCDLVEPPPKRLSCAICLRPLRDPLLTSCGHSFCTSCLKTNFQISQLCPVCNQCYTSFPDAGIAREVKTLRVRCRNKQAGCEWTGDLGKVEEHSINCGFASLRCTKCGQLIQRRLMTKHQDLLCPLRQYDCDYCRTYVNTYNDVTKNHWPVCNFFPVPCPNDCPKGSIPRNRLMEHIRSECRVKKDGKQLAEVKKQRDNLLEKLHHLQDCLERKKGEAQDAGIKKLEEQQQEMTTAMDELQDELWKKDKKISEMAVEQEELQRKLRLQQQGARRGNGGGRSAHGHSGGGDGGREPFSSVVSNREEPRPDLSVAGGVRLRSSTSPDQGLDRRPRETETPRVQFVQTVQLPPTHPPGGHPQVPEQPNLVHNSNVSVQWKQSDDPLPEAMYSGHAVLVGNFVYAGGGICQKKDSECIISKYDCQNETWCSLPRVNRKGFAMVGFQHQLVLIGGITAGARNVYLTDLAVWDETQHRWDLDRYPPMNTARMHSTAVAHEIYIAVAGGTSTRSLDIVEVFDSDRKEWHTKASLPVKVYCATSAFIVSEAALYIMGGNGLKKSVYTATLNQLILSNEQTPSANVWKPLPDTQYTNATVAAFGKSIIAIGGKSFGAVNAVRVYFPGMRMWLRVEKELPRSFYSCAAVVNPTNELLLIGGCSNIDWCKHMYKGMLKQGT